MRWWLGLFITYLYSVNCQFDDGQREAVDQVFGGGSQNSDIFGQYEVISEPTSGGELSAIDRCGEGRNRGVNICVPYYNCDGATNFVKVESSTDGFGIIDIR